MSLWLHHIKPVYNKSCLLSTFNLGCGVSAESRDNGVFMHDEAHITIIRYLLQADDDGRQVVYGWPFKPHLAVLCDGMKTSRRNVKS